MTALRFQDDFGAGFIVILSTSSMKQEMLKVLAWRFNVNDASDGETAECLSLDT